MDGHKHGRPHAGNECARLEAKNKQLQTKNKKLRAQLKVKDGILREITRDLTSLGHYERGHLQGVCEKVAGKAKQALRTPPQALTSTTGDRR